MKELFSKKLNIGVGDNGGGGGVAAGGKTGKKSVGLLGGIFKRLLPLGVLLSLKPVTDLLKVVTNFIILGFLTLAKLLIKFNGLTAIMDLIKLAIDVLPGVIEKVVEWSKRAWEAIKEGFKNAVDWIKALPNKIWEFLKSGFTSIKEKLVEWFSKTVDWLKNLAGLIWDKMKQGFQWIKDKVIQVWNAITSFAQTLTDRVKDLKKDLVDWLKKSWQNLKELPGKIWDKIKQGFEWIKDKVTDVWDSIKTLPQKIWDKMKELASLIANKLRSIIGGLNPFRRSTSVGDAIIKPNGDIIRTDPKDTIIATKTPGDVGGGAKTFNFYGVTPQEMIEVIKRELGTDVLRSTRF